ncbi:unnamed protein product [Malus baccata var. baccata]
MVCSRHSLSSCSIYRCSVKLDKVDFLKLQNGSDIRGVAIAGVEGERISLTEPVSEAIQLLLLHASHLPYNRNGFKFFTNSGGLGKPDNKNILERAADIYDKFTVEGLTNSKQNLLASVKRVDCMNVYTSDLVKAVRKAAGNIEKPLEGFHIVVDKGNGAGGFFAAKVLEPLGAVTTGSHVALRSAAVDSTGLEFNRNRLIAFMSAIVLEEQFLVGGKHHRFKRSYKNVVDEAIRLNSIGEESHLAIETSDHGALKENHCLDDGAYLMVKILNKLASACASGQISGNGGWFLLRLSLRDPVLPFNIEAPSNSGAMLLGNVVLAAVKEFPALDTCFRQICPSIIKFTSIQAENPLASLASSCLEKCFPALVVRHHRISKTFVYLYNTTVQRLSLPYFGGRFRTINVEF